MTFPASPSAITAPNRTYAGLARAQGIPEPIRRFTQEQWRPRRRQRLITEELSEPFSPSREIADVAGPFAVRLTRLWGPLRFRPLVFAYADAAHECVSALIGWQAEADGRAKTTHLKDEPGKRKYAVTLIKDLAQRPELPEITDEMIADGSWVAALLDMAAAADELSVAAVYSDRLEKLLREGIDLAALNLARKLAWAESQPPPPPPPLPPVEQARAELAAMGIEIETSEETR